MLGDSTADAITRGVDALLLKLRARDTVSAEEEKVLRDSVTEVREYGAGRVIVRSGVELSESNLLADGIVSRYQDLANGQRQIMELHVPGDFVDLHSFLLKRLEHNVGALSAARILIVPHEKVRWISEHQPHLTRLLWLSTLLDSAIHREKIVSVGRRSAVAAIAHMMCELYVRLHSVGLAGDMRFALPLTQSDIADATGLTSVHVNRMLKQLRDEGLLTFRNGETIIHDWEGLQRIAEFRQSYLFLERRPR